MKLSRTPTFATHPVRMGLGAACSFSCGIRMIDSGFRSSPRKAGTQIHAPWRAWIPAFELVNYSPPSLHAEGEAIQNAEGLDRFVASLLATTEADKFRASFAGMGRERITRIRIERRASADGDACALPAPQHFR